MRLTDLDIDRTLEEVNYVAFKKRLEQLLYDGDIVIVTHKNADGDALASVACIKEILSLTISDKDLVRDVMVVTPGGVPHPQNKAMLTISKIITHETMPNRHGPIILVDAANSKQANVGLGDIPVAIAIDPGHITEPDDDTLFIGGDARATCTITTLLYLKFRMELEKHSSIEEIEPNSTLATLVHFGVVQDTNDCSIAEATSLDDWVRRWSYAHQDPEIYRRIKMFPVPRTFRLIEQHGLNHLIESGSLIVACLGYIKKDYVDLVSTFADQRRRQEQVRKVVSMGIVREEDESPKIKVSVRTELDTLDTVADIKALIGPRSGGAQGMAAGEAELGYRADLIRLANGYEEDGSETEILSSLFLDLLQRWKDQGDVPEVFVPLDNLLRMLVSEVGYDDDQKQEMLIQWFRHHREIWSQNRKVSGLDKDDTNFPSQEEELAELFREADPERSGTAPEVMESLLFHQIARRARNIFGEEN